MKETTAKATKKEKKTRSESCDHVPTAVKAFSSETDEIDQVN
jgi:hypothetical protein